MEMADSAYLSERGDGYVSLRFCWGAGTVRANTWRIPQINDYLDWGTARSV